MNFFKKTLDLSTPLLIAGIFLSVIGIFAFVGMPRALFPEVNYPRVVVEISLGYSPLQVMEWGVASPLEKELRAVPGVRLVTSATTRGLTTIDVFLQQNQSVTLAVQRVSSKIAEIRSQLPPDAVIRVRPITAAAFPGAEYCFVSKKVNQRDLRTFVNYTIKPQILVIPGIFNSITLGGDSPQFTVDLNAKKMALWNLTVADIQSRIRHSNGVDFLGPVEESDGSEVLAFGGKFTSTKQEIENIVVDSTLGRAIHLGDIAKVHYGNAWKTRDLSLNGRECVALDIFYQQGINQNTTSKKVSATIARIISKQNDISYKSWDLNDFTNRATSAVIFDLIFGMLIISLVTFGFLRSIRYSLVALASLPLATAFTFLAMKALHLSINLMTLGGLAAAIGLVVDNTVIILEMYHHQKDLHPNRNRKEILGAVLTNVIKPMIFGTVTIALVFMPIGMLSGISGMFFAPMAEVGSSALILSVFLAVLVVPGLILLFDKKDLGKHVKHGVSRFIRFYERLLGFLLKKSKAFVLMLVLVPLLGLIALKFAKTGFLPVWDEGDLVIDFRAVKSLGLQATIQQLKPLENYLKSLPQVDFFIRKAGTAMGELNKMPSHGEIVLKLKDKRKKSVFQIANQISAEAPKIIPGFELDLHQILPDRLNDLSGSGKPIVLYLRGPDANELDRAAEIYRKYLARIHGLSSVQVTQQGSAPEFHYAINETLSRALGLSPRTIDENARAGLFSMNASSVQIGPQTIPIRLQIDHLRYKTQNLADLPLYTSRGGLETLGRIGKIKTVENPVESDHINGQPIRSVTAELSGIDLGTAIQEVKAVLRKHTIKHVYTQLAGDYQTQQKSFHELILAFLTGIAMIFLTSLFFSNRVKVALSLAAMSLIPPSIGLFGLVLMNIPLDVSAFSGLISVTGIAVANSFMAIAAIEADPEIHRDFKGSIKRGMSKRLRPIMMTNLAAMAGFIPIAIGLSKGDEILRPFSLAIIIGLFGAMYTTLVVMPTAAQYFLNTRRRVLEPNSEQIEI